VYDGTDGFPDVNFGAACGGQTSEQASKAPGLLYCTQLASDIQGCQALGKKVFISLGGAVGQSTFTSDTDGQNFAHMVWNLFGGGTAYDDQLRPFGSVKIDGFDVGK
jgi:chitinase